MSGGSIANRFEFLDSIKIKYAGNSVVDVTDAYTNVYITEDLFKNSLSCTLNIGDASGSLDPVDFDGTETFKLAFKSLLEDDREISVVFRVYKVDVTIDPQKNDIKMYQLSAVTPEHYKQSTMDINQSFKMPINEAVKNVFDKLGSSRKIDIDETTGTYTYIVPGMTPYESMEFFQRRAYDSTFKSSLFTFYETVDGFNFKNIEKLINDNRNDPITYKFTPIANSSENDDDPMHVIQEMDLSSNKDIMKKIKSGAYANAVQEIDLINQKVNSSKVQIKEDFSTFKHLDDVAMSLDSKAIIDEHLNIINSTQWINKIDNVSDKRSELIPRRKFYFDCLSQVQMDLVVPGNSNLSVGKVIEIDLLELSGKTEERQQEPKISGKYLITKLSHVLGRGSYTCNVVCNKESYKANSDDIKKNLVVKQ
jgi:hypothetical protein